MLPLSARSSLTDRVYEAILDEICNGAIEPGTHLVQEQIAARLDVSRQPVQQAMARLKADGLLAEVGRRGLQVTPLNLALMRHHYDIRAALDGLAARLAAMAVRAGAEGPRRAGEAILRAGAEAIATGDIAEQVRQDAAFHRLIYDASQNPLLADAAEPHWRFLRRAMSQVLRHAQRPATIWQQHADILAAIVAGDAESASRKAVDHCLSAADRLGNALANSTDGRTT
ncbi:MAG: GntR family transcriptional regulator [Methylobacterium sp.]|nr:MAG: GntR family transcriptional regulator [Methylobacterium sp.]